MNNNRKRVLAAGMVIMMVLSSVAGTTVYAAAKASLGQTKVTVGIGKTKTIRTEKTIADYVLDYMLSGNQNVIVPRENYDTDLHYAGTKEVPMCW